MASFFEKAAVSVKEFCQRLKGKKNIEIFIAIVIISVLLIIYSNISLKKTNSQDATESANTVEYVATDTEMRLSGILSQISGAGSVQVMITSTASNSDDAGNASVGIIIVAEGADDVKVRMELIRATQTVLKVNANQISVFTMKK